MDDWKTKRVIVLARWISLGSSRVKELGGPDAAIEWARDTAPSSWQGARVDCHEYDDGLTIVMTRTNDDDYDTAVVVGRGGKRLKN